MAKIRKFLVYLAGKHTARNATVITSFMRLASKPLGYVRNLLVAYFFGASAFVDSYYVAWGAVYLVMVSIESAIESAVLPKMVQSSDEEARDLLGCVVRAVIFLVPAVSLAMVLFSGPYVKIFAGSFDKERLDLASGMIKWVLPQALAGFVMYILTVYGNYQGRFVLSTMAGSATNFIAIPALFALYPILGNYALPAFMGVAYTGTALALLYPLRDIPLRPKNPLDRGLLKKTAGDIGYCMVGTGAGFIYTIVDRYFASSLPVGNVSAVSYAQLIFNQPIGFLSGAMSIYLVRASAAVKDKSEGERHLFSTLYMAWSYFFPASVLLALLSKPLVKLLLGYGAFDARAVELTAPCLSVIALGLPMAVLGMVMGRYAQALGKLRLVTFWSYAGIVGNFFLDWLFVKPYGAPGLCAATSIMWGVSAFFYMVMMAPSLMWRLARAAASQTVFAFLWGGFFHIVVADGLAVQIAAGAAMAAAHLFICGKLGYYDAIPEPWRPGTLVKVTVNKAKYFAEKLVGR